MALQQFPQTKFAVCLLYLKFGIYVRVHACFSCSIVYTRATPDRLARWTFVFCMLHYFHTSHVRSLDLLRSLDLFTKFVASARVYACVACCIIGEDEHRRHRWRVDDDLGNQHCSCRGTYTSVRRAGQRNRCAMSARQCG